MENVKVNIYSKFLYLKNKLTYKNILKALVIIATIVIAYNCLTKIAYADGFLSYGNSDDPYKSIQEGWGQFIADKYRNNYALDIIDTHGWELIDKAITGLTNIVFSGIVMISWFGVNIFRFCFTNDIAAGFANQLNSVLGSLNNGIFNNFFMIVFMISLFSIVYNLYKKNFSAIGSQILAVAIIYATTAFLSNGAVGFLSKTTEFSKTIGTSAIVAINGKENNEGSLEDYSKTVVGTLWGNFVQQPWVILEFDGKVSLIKNNKDNDDALNYSKEILSEPYGSDEREKALESINEKFNKELFSKNGINTKLVSVCVLFVITLIKMIILIAVGMIQIGFQLMSILLILLLPFIMLIAIVPFFGGTNIIKGIARKYLGTQLGIIVSSFVLALLVLVDTVTLTMFQSWGANLIIALLMQCTCWIMVIAFRKQLMNGLINLQNRIAPGTAGAFKFGAKPLDKGADIAKEYAVNPAMDRAYDIGDNLITKAQYAKEYTKGNLSLYKDRKVAQAIDFLGSKYDNLKNNKPEDIENANNPKENIDGVKDTKNKVNSNENINKKPVEKFDLNGVKATKPIDTNSNITSENIPNKNINGENKPNIDEEAVTKNDIKDPIENKDIAPKTIDENIKNNGNDTGTIQDKSPGSKEKTISEDEEITTKPEEIKTPEKTINKENLNELKNENTSADRKNNYSNSSNTSVTEVPEDLVEEKSVEAINKAKNDIKVNKEKMNNNISSKNTESSPEAKENIEVASSPEVTEIKKKSTKKVENIKNNGQSKEKSPDKKQIKEVSTKERVERVKSFMGVSNKDIKSKEKHLENKLECIKKGNSKNFKKKES